MKTKEKNMETIGFLFVGLLISAFIATLVNFNSQIHSVIDSIFTKLMDFYFSQSLFMMVFEGVFSVFILAVLVVSFSDWLDS